MLVLVAPVVRLKVTEAVNIVKRSHELYTIRYLEYLGDGDSKAYFVCLSKTYGNTKIECIGRIQKRMGSRLRTLKFKTNKSPKWEVLRR